MFVCPPISFSKSNFFLAKILFDPCHIKKEGIKRYLNSRFSCTCKEQSLFFILIPNSLFFVQNYYRYVGFYNSTQKSISC